LLPFRTARELDCSNFAIVCDRLQLKANGRNVEGARLHNGELVTVARVEPTGVLVVMSPVRTRGCSRLNGATGNAGRCRGRG
jgi:hypothetical protein